MKSQIFRNPWVIKVVEYESEDSIRLAQRFEKIYLPEHDLAQNLKNSMKPDIQESYLEAWKGKMQHGCYYRYITQDSDVHSRLTNSWLTKKGISSHAEGYLAVTH